MKRNPLLILSLLLNIAFVMLCCTVAFKYKDRIIQKLAAWYSDCKIVMLGDSITAQGNWITLLERQDVVNSGMPGLCTYHFLGLIQSEVISHKPAICFVMTGINDIIVGVAPQKIQSNYQQILERIIANGITPVVTLTLYEQNDPASYTEVTRLNNFLIRYCTANQIEYIDLNPVLSDTAGLKPEYAVDKTHLNRKAYDVWAREVSRVLAKRKI